MNTQMKIEATVAAVDFTAYVSRMHSALAKVSLLNYADHIFVIAPRNPADFVRFVQWSERLCATLQSWMLAEPIGSKDARALGSAYVAAFDVATMGRRLIERHAQA